MGYAVSTPVFEGPFDLLLHLILREQVDLYDISLSTIVDAYIAELNRMEHLDLEVATEFLLIAATLVELKTKRLLPGDDDVDVDEDLSLWEERDLLLARLLECKTFKDAAGMLSALHSAASRSVPRTAGPDDRFWDLTPDMLEGVTPDQLRAAYQRAITPQPQPTIDLFHVAPIRMSVIDTVADLCVELPSRRRVSFRELTSSLVDRLDVVVHFLAILELFKQGLVDLDQPDTFGDIQVVWVGGADVGAEDLALVDAYDG
ncbi:segregation and condensation protein A [Dermatobacter hominis]|uniref:segregation and condensation protein A n=1 Tax=Dermatobacter hominis TaxID=2884263 RepID=UPI001D12681F|nr:ScpA family protein [Dermatobacter hominis]UDY36256.1 segregation/condensation protein A [Dermatobacter hominis]